MQKFFPIFLLLAFLGCAGMKGSGGPASGGALDAAKNDLPSDLGSGQHAQSDGTVASQPSAVNLEPLVDKKKWVEDKDQNDTNPAPQLGLNHERPFGAMINGFVPLECGSDQALKTWAMSWDKGNLRGNIVTIVGEKAPLTPPYLLAFVNFGNVEASFAACSPQDFDGQVTKDFKKGISYQVVKTDTEGHFEFPLQATGGDLVALLVLKESSSEGGFQLQEAKDYLQLLFQNFWVGSFEARKEVPPPPGGRPPAPSGGRPSGPIKMPGK